VVVRVPASSANLGPGFDTLGMALSLHLELSLEASPGFAAVPDGHPSAVAFRSFGGDGSVYVRSPIPMGRGLGFARIAGLLGAAAQHAGGRFDAAEVADEVLARASALEGHADNVAASLHGGVVATAGGRAVAVPLAFDPTVVVWVPSSITTSTDESRGRLPTTVSLGDATFNVGRTAMLVAALAGGHLEVLRIATEDRLHQDVRFAASPASKRALDAALDAGAWCGWLSGSGPTVAALCAADRAEALAAALPLEQDASVKVLRIDHAGAVVEVGRPG
jgi:homoserine kinase